MNLLMLCYNQFCSIMEFYILKEFFRLLIFLLMLRALNNHNAQIKQRYYYYNYYYVFLCVHFFAFFNQINQILVNKLRIFRQGKGDPHIKRYFVVLNSHSFFFCVSNSIFLFLSFIYVLSLQQTKRIRKKQIKSNKKKKTSHCKIQGAVNTLMACRISFIPAKKTSNVLQCLLNEL